MSRGLSFVLLAVPVLVNCRRFRVGFCETGELNHGLGENGWTWAKIFAKNVFSVSSSELEPNFFDVDDAGIDDMNKNMTVTAPDVWIFRTGCILPVDFSGVVIYVDAEINWARSHGPPLLHHYPFALYIGPAVDHFNKNSFTSVQNGVISAIYSPFASTSFAQRAVHPSPIALLSK
jgi:hypothetical protein